MKLYSFDIFDTLITRNCFNPTGIYLIMEYKLKNQNLYSTLPNILRENFFIIRKESEKFARKNERIFNNKQEITFDDIYKVIKNNYNLSEEQINSLKALEIDTEQKNLIGINHNINKIKRLIAEGYEVILISDMYFSSDILRKFLVNIDLIFTKIKIYTSCDYNFTKKNGLYKLIKKDYPMTKYWIHTGDNFMADILSAKINGIKAVKFKPENLLEYEKYIMHKRKNDYKSELIVGCAKNLRINNKNSKYQFGCSFAGPLLYNYTKWILQQCILIGITNLYFVSRDGFILKKIADILITENNLSLKTNYFYSSRIASRVITNDNYEDSLAVLFTERHTKKNLDRILHFLNITIKELNNFLPIKKIKNTKLLKQELLKNTELRQLIINKNQIKKDLFKNYIKQEIPKACNKIAFIDLNGTGRTQDITTEIINSIMPCETYNFYLNRNITKIPQISYSIKCSYNPSPNFQAGWIELLCRCPEGQTIGYHKSKDKIVPIKEFNENKHIMKWGFEDYLQGILDYTFLMNKIENLNNLDTNSLNLYLDIFEYIQTKLDKNTADLLGTIPFSAYGNEKFIKECAPKINLLNIFSHIPMDYISIARCPFITKPFWKIARIISNPKTYGYIYKKYKINVHNVIWKQKNYINENVKIKER